MSLLLDHYDPSSDPHGSGRKPQERFRKRKPDGSGRPSRALPRGWPRWPVICEGKIQADQWKTQPDGTRIYVRFKGDPCRAWAVPGSYYCRRHGGYMANDRLRMRRYLLFTLTGIAKPKTDLATEMMVAGEIEAILNGNRQGCGDPALNRNKASDKVRAEIVLAALKAGIIGPP